MTIDMYGMEALSWPPQVLADEFSADFGIQIPAVNLAKILVAIDLVQSDQFYRSLPRFIFACNILSNSFVEPGEFDPADASEIAWGITEAMLIYPSEVLTEEQGEPFSLDITAYIGRILAEEGIVNPPDVLRIGLTDDSDPFSYWVDDPDLYASMFAMQEERTGEIKSMLKENLQQLLEQLADLQLENGDTAELKKIVESRIEEETAPNRSVLM